MQRPWGRTTSDVFEQQWGGQCVGVEWVRGEKTTETGKGGLMGV